MSASADPAWSEDVSSVPTLVDTVYKTTSLGGFVVDRRTELYHKFFITYHDYEKQPMDNRKWVLDSKCTLEPATATAIKASSRKIRPRGTWSVTATVTAVVKSALPEMQLVRPGRASHVRKAGACPSFHYMCGDDSHASSGARLLLRHPTVTMMANQCQSAGCCCHARVLLGIGHTSISHPRAPVRVLAYGPWQRAADFSFCPHRSCGAYGM